MGSSSSSCAPCDNPCPDGFTYTEECGYWWWEADEFACTPDDSLISDDAIGRGVSYTKSSTCPCAIWGGCGSEVSEVDDCDAGSSQVGLTTWCCDSPNLCQTCCDDDYGFAQTRTCERSDPHYVFRFTKPYGDPAYCSQRLYEYMTEFPVCQFCDKDKSAAENSDGYECWLPYLVNADNECFAASPTTTGWFKMGDTDWYATDEAGEERFNVYGNMSDITTYDTNGVSSTNTHAEAAAVTAGASVAVTLLLLGTHRLFKRKQRTPKLTESAVAETELSPAVSNPLE